MVCLPSAECLHYGSAGPIHHVWGQGTRGTGKQDAVQESEVGAGWGSEYRKAAAACRAKDIMPHFVRMSDAMVSYIFCGRRVQQVGQSLPDTSHRHGFSYW